MPVDVLAFSPHPDDAEIGCGGLLLLAAQQGLRTVIVDLSEGERATRGTPQMRAREKALAGELLTLHERTGLGLPDTAIGTMPEHEAAVVGCLRRIRPRLVLAPVAENRHPDHAAASRLVERAVVVAGIGSDTPHHVERLLYYTIHEPVVPDLVFDITGVWEQRERVLDAYRSQFSGDGPRTALSGGGFREVLRARSRHYGAMINARYGEPYVSRAPLYVDSLGSLLRPPGSTPGYGSFR